MRPVRKAFTFFAHCLFFYMAARFALGETVWGLTLPGQLLTLNAILLTVIYALFNQILRSYGNIFSRLLSREAMLFGFPLSTAAAGLGFYQGNTLVGALGVASFFAWVFFAVRYKQRSKCYEIQGAGPVPLDTCIKIPAALVRPGDAIGTGGQMAKLLRQGVAHTECVIPWEGKLMLFSSWFEEGAFLNDVARILKPDPKYPNYLLQRRPPLSAEQIELMEYVVRAMRMQNAQYKERVNKGRERMPTWLKRYMDKKFPVTGYDWLGRYTGRRAPDRWTCNVAYLEVMRRSCVDVVRLGQGAAGLRTGWFDFPNTEDLRGDPALHLVRNAEVPSLMANGTPHVDLNSDIPDFDAKVAALVDASTNVFKKKRS